MPQDSPTTAPSRALQPGRCRWHHLPGRAQLALVDILGRARAEGVLAHVEKASPPDALWLSAVATGAVVLALPEAFPLHLARLAGDGILWSVAHAALTWLGLTLSFVGFAGILRRLRIDRHVPLSPGSWLLAQGVIDWDGRWLTVSPVPAGQPRVVPGRGPGGTQRPELRWGSTHFLLPAGMRPPEVVAELGRQRRREDEGAPAPVPWDDVMKGIRKLDSYDVPALSRADRTERVLLRVALPAALLATPPFCPDEVRTVLGALVEGPHMARELGAGARLHLRAEGLARVAPPPSADAAFLAAATTSGTTTYVLVEPAEGLDSERAAQEAVQALAARFGGLPGSLRVRIQDTENDLPVGPYVRVRPSAAGTQAWLELGHGDRLQRAELLSVAAPSAAPAPAAPGLPASERPAAPPAPAPPAPRG